MSQWRKPNDGTGSHNFRMNPQVITKDIELYKDIFEEGVQIYGDDIIFIRKEYIQQENIFGEHLIHKLKDSFKMRAFVEQTDGWVGAGDMFSKFGLRNEEECTMHIPKNMFIDLGFVPKIGDIVYHNTSKSLWEIESVVDDKLPSFHPLGQHISYVLQMKSFLFDHLEASEEILDSTDENIEKITQVLFGDDTQVENAVQFDIDEKNEEIGQESVKIIDDKEKDPLGF